MKPAFWMAWWALAAGAGVAVPLSAAEPQKPPPATNAVITAAAQPMKDQVLKPDAEWKKTLTPEQFRILRQKGTERAFTGAYWNTKEAGIYRCAGCGLELFSSTNKFDSGCGWPSYDQPVRQNAVTTAPDRSHQMQRIEVLCSRCNGHLGHVFDDGPAATTGLRYCINSGALTFEKLPAPARPAK